MVSPDEPDLGGGGDDKLVKDDIGKQPNQNTAVGVSNLLPTQSPPGGRVRFSTDASRPAVTSTIQEKSAKDPQQASSAIRSPVPPKSTPVSDTAASGSSSRKRHRGYSLRRALFAQNIEKHERQDGLSFEMEPPSSTTTHVLKSDNATMDEKRETKVTVSESVDDEDTLPVRPIRLPVTPGESSLYHRWISRETKHPRFIRLALESWRNFSKRLFQSKQIPSSVDGRHVRVNPMHTISTIDERTGNPYINNKIRSCRYTLYNFFPRQLAAQFGKIANFYFLIVSTLQMIPGLSTTGTYTTIVPLLVFVGISMAKEGYDDIRRNRLDKEENEREIKILAAQSSAAPQSFSSDAQADYPVTRSNFWKTEKWQDIKVGDVVLLQRDAAVPADVVLLHANHESSSAYVETKSLDGETNLKTKQPLSDVRCLCTDLDAISDLSAEFVVEDPNLDLYKFDGRVSVAGKTLPLTNNEVIYRSSVLRNTASAVGLVIYSGEECKIRMNANKNPRIKAPSLQFKVNKVVIIVASLVVFIAVLLTVLYQVWRRTTESHAWYLSKASVPFHEILMSFIIMFNTMLPLSLYVSLEIVKVCQMFLMNDIDMYDPASDIPMEPHTSTINEELGQVSYIFSDKTGTLTNNSMRFRKLSVAGTTWLHDIDLQEDAANRAGRPRLRHKKRGGKGKEPSRQKKSRNSIWSTIRKSTTSMQQSINATRVSLDTFQWQPSSHPAQPLDCGKTEELLEYLIRKPHSIFASKAKFFILGIALCHTCMPEKDDEGNINYQAASPDELALVTAAQDLGYIVTDRQTGSITVKTYPMGDEEDPVYESYEVLDVIEFSSARKRMSIIVKFPNQKICLFTKGADTILRKCLKLANLAAVSTTNVDRRASERKSLEAQEAIRRKSMQAQTTLGPPRPSISLAGSPRVVGRNSSISMTPGRSARQSIDMWLKERESDVGQAVSRKSNMYYSPRASAHQGALRLSENRLSMAQIDSGRPSFQTEDYDDLIDETVVLSDALTFEHCFQHIDDFATEGLRTLLYGYKYVSDEEYAEWKNIYTAASTSLVDRQDKMEAAGELIETHLELLGATAIEDKLQDGVPDAIDRFRRAGIKMWMLTGDKRETAINIGHSCRLIKDYSTMIVIDHELGNLGSAIIRAVTKINDSKTAHSVLVIDGQTLSEIDADPTLKASFTDLAIQADSVICCRASPSQKASLVRTIRTKVRGSVTLAIGDGANDIAMIQEAHLGIGIAGKEGLQAARTSDYSIAQFRFLLKLLLVHGRWNYIRVCKYTLGTFWKEMLFYLVQAMFQRWDGYTGTSLYEPWSLSMFNTLFTSLPVILMGVFEKDLAASTLLAVPELYSIGQKNQGFNFKIYAWWATLGATESVIVYFTMYSIFGEAVFTRDNRLYAMGSLAFTACVTLISLKLQFIELHNRTIAAVIAIVLSVGGWWLWSVALSTFYADNTIYSVKNGLLLGFGRNLLWWMTLILIVVSVCLFEITVKSIKAAVWPSDVDTFQAYEQDREVRKRFEEAAADLLQQGWDRGTKKSSLDLAREEAEQLERENQVQELLDRPRTMITSPMKTNVKKDDDAVVVSCAAARVGDRANEIRAERTGYDQSPARAEVDKDEDGGVRRRHSGPTDDGELAVKLGRVDDENVSPHLQRSSVDVSELFSKGFGSVRKSLDLR